ncbi:MAG: hypothetical protein KAS66_03385 [Candidatus Omnitrophica bacterium]|nr:hypothetical protein [Candidatus Omnitrophota bacterium]
MNKLMILIRCITKEEIRMMGTTLFRIGIVGTLSALFYLSVLDVFRELEIFMIELHSDVSALNLASKIAIVFAIIGVIGIIIHVAAYEQNGENSNMEQCK